MRWIGVSGDLGGRGRTVGIDFETTGFDPVHDRIVQVGIVTYDGPFLVEKWISPINPEGVKLHPEAAKVNGFSDEELLDAPPFVEEAEERLREMTSGRLVVAHRLPFDVCFWAESCLRVGLDPPERHGVCSKVLAAAAGYKGSLLGITERLNIEFTGKDHDALNDAEASVLVAKRLASQLGGTAKAIGQHEIWATQHIDRVNPYGSQKHREMYAAAHGYQVAV